MTSNPMVLSITDLFEEACTYRVPIYQRAYAWESGEIETLLDDIRSAANRGTPYYLGSLVVARHNDEQNTYEVIDGQQRLTTLYLLMAVLRHIPDNYEGAALPKWNMRLQYECRDEYEQVLKQCWHGASLEQLTSTIAQAGSSVQAKMCRPLLDGYRIIYQYMKTPDKWINTSYLLGNVKLVRDELPSETDFNRYFEIMNTRGVQLRPEDIVKARLMSAVHSQTDREAIGRIWDICSDMDHYMQACATTGERDRWFGKDWSSCPPDDWSQLIDGCDCGDVIAGSNDIRAFNDVLGEACLMNHSQRIQETQPTTQVEDEGESYRSIISFPGFLMHVLRIHCGDESVPLDDAELLNAFDKTVFNTSQEEDMAARNTKQFTATLLRCRFLFDNYIIKSHSDSGAPLDAAEWTLRRYASSATRGKRTHYFANMFADGCQREVVMIQSMFQVTETGNNHKNALYSILQWVWKRGHIGGRDFLQELRRQSQRRLKKTLNLESGQTEGDWQSRICAVVNRGVGTEHFIFNYLDYVLWSLLSPERDTPSISAVMTGEGQLIAERVREAWKEYAAASENYGEAQRLDCSRFRFRYRNSVEHFFPQHPLSGEKAPADVDSFGNLCLMTVRENSRRNNLDPMEKIRHFNVGQQSLKFQFMVGKAVGEGGWSRAQIEEQTTLWVRLLGVLAGDGDAASDGAAV